MKQFPTIMNNRIDYIEDRIWIQKKIQLQEYFNKLEPKHSIVSSLGIPLKYSGYFALIPSNLDLEAHLAQYPITDYMGSVVILGGLTFVNFPLCIHLC